MARILDGRWLSKQIELSITERVATRVKEGLRPPGLGVILVGDNPASLAYVGRKEKIAKRCGFVTKEERIPADCTEEQLSAAIKSYNEDSQIDGILLQLPIPDHLNTEKMLDQILPSKDADGLHPLNQGFLLRGEGELRPCTPSGLMKFIDLALSDIPLGDDRPETINIEKDLPAVDLSGKNAIVIGRSILVGKAAAFLLLERNATVTIGHSRTKDLPSLAREADIVVAAVGREEMVTGDWIKEGAIVIDVGINRNSEGKLVGDVEYTSALEKASAITPVPGGVGPMTVIMLMQNTLQACEASDKK